MIGLLRPRRGEVLVDGVPLAKLSIAQAARSVGYVFQSPSHMLFAPSVREEMAFGPRNIGQSEAEIAAHTAEALALMGLSNLLERAPLTVPVTMTAIMSGEDSTNALDMRGFGLRPRTWLHARPLRPVDWALIVLSLGLLLAGLAWRAVGGGALWVPPYPW
jgi:hypothetical protein